MRVFRGVRRLGLGQQSPYFRTSATESLSLAILRQNHRKARHSGLICEYVVAEEITIR